MTIHRVKPVAIPAADFKPEKAKGFRPKTLRWFENEHLKHPDCSLRVKNERDGSFELWADHVFVPLNQPKDAPTGAATTIGTGSESLAQSIVDKIEVAPVSNLTPDCDFVIFQDSPLIRAECLQKGQ